MILPRSPVIPITGKRIHFAAKEINRRGRYAVPKRVVRAAPTKVRNARERSLGVRGVQIFNLLPDQLRSMNSQHIDYFKNHLDVFAKLNFNFNYNFN